MFKMLVRILNTLRSRIWDMPVFLFSDYTKFTVGRNGGLNANFWFSVPWLQKEISIWI
ncbi:hypothetical protein [Anaerobutyricum soehngenii]|uniref:hypothetical protein n=1 Tax=Anaerobutyricum soehngenii TaxID=105843 RepID=UPI001ADD7F9D|nr:hypothetical protein [Anaerobutyricum soehngenii]